MAPKRTSKPSAPTGDPSYAIQRIFDGWYNDANYHAFLDLLETVVANAQTDGRPLAAESFFAGVGPDPLKVRARVDRPYTREKLARALALVVENARTPLYRRASNPDALGTPYCMLKSSKALGQFFTPWSVSRATAMMMADVEGDLLHRVREAMEKAGHPLPPGRLRAEDAFAQYVGTFAPYFEPFRMLEPCMGAGSMLLAFASQVPPWALAVGAVQITGIDLDPRAVQMARINCLLFGVPARLYCGNSLLMTDLKALRLTARLMARSDWRWRSGTQRRLASWPRVSSGTRPTFRLLPNRTRRPSRPSPTGRNLSRPLP